jgi:hypothetical protein
VRGKDEAVPVIERGMVAIYRELESARRDRVRERLETPEYLAELEAQRTPLHRMGVSVRMIPALAIPFTKVVPEEFWRAVALGMADMRCVCGAKGIQLVAGEPVGCGCGRWFLFTGQSVRVAVFEEDPDYVEEPLRGC